MPFKSDSQRRWMWANKPKMAKRWQKETGNKDLPEKLSAYYDIDNKKWIHTHKPKGNLVTKKELDATKVGFLKEAVNLRTLRKAGKTYKSMKLRRSLDLLDPTVLRMRKPNTPSLMGVGSMRASRELEKKPYLFGSYAMPKYEKGSKDLYRKIYTGKGGGIANIAPAKKSVEKQIKHAPKEMRKQVRALGRKNWSKKQNEVLNRVMNMHEVSELSVKPKEIGMLSSHMSPKVLLQEHNMISTLPKKYAPAKKYMQSLRSLTGESGMLKALGVEYGGARISRHKIKGIVKGFRKKLKENDPSKKVRVAVAA